jgi:hypothetical protein
MIVFVVLLVMLFGGGCAYRDSVLFVTKTSLGIDVDSKPPSASIAYDRVEGFLGPRYDNGGVPPVVGRLQTDGAVFNPRVRQLYATGSAAALVADQNASAGPTELKGKKMFMFFGTTTSTGLKVTFMGQYPDSFHIGYRRKEFSFIPLGHTKNSAGEDVDIYPSVLATLDNRLQVGTNPVSGPTSGLQVGQLFATGVAADEYARSAVVRQLFQDEVTAAIEGLRSDIRDIRTQDRAFSGKAATLIDRVGGDKIDAAVLLAINDGLMSESDRARAGSDLDAKRAYLKKIARAGDDREMLSKLKKFVDDLEALVGGGG